MLIMTRLDDSSRNKKITVQHTNKIHSVLLHTRTNRKNSTSTFGMEESRAHLEAVASEITNSTTTSDNNNVCGTVARILNSDS
mmetsp:Transcript_21094/g.32443  ORF Transcript_21094/g.32443 Transcript_21094/m.32443 type:complete len:83 (+) Transcript_21094:376-624(+)